MYTLVAIAAAPAVSARSYAAGEVIVTFEPGSTYVDVPAKINGTLDVTFRLDTGAMGSTIDAATAKKLGIAKSRVVLMSGETSREKTFLLEHLSQQEVTNLLANPVDFT